MTKISKDQKKRIEACDALNFLREHPAINPDIMGDSLFDGEEMHMDKCCKRGIAECSFGGIVVNRGDEGWEKFKAEFEEDYADDDTPEEFQYIYADYDKVYGEPWVFDHVEYWYETLFFVFDGDDPYSFSDSIDYTKWDRFAGVSGKAMTFEDAMIQQANEVRKIYGDFNEDDFLTEVEKKNHEKQKMFLNLGENNGLFSLDHNPEYLEVPLGLINLRWLQWFIDTDYCKKQWEFSMDMFREKIANIDLKMPSSRKKIINKY